VEKKLGVVYNLLGNIFSWLSTHQGLTLIIILVVLGLMIYLILRIRKYGKLIKKQATGQKIEIGKKDALIEEQQSNLAALQKKLSDQQTVVGEALLGTIMSLTGYNLDQLRIFVKFLTGIGGNPLLIADTQASTISESPQLEKESGDSTEENDRDEKTAPSTGPEEDVEADKDDKIAPSAGPVEVAEADKNDKIAPSAGPVEVAEADKNEKNAPGAGPEEDSEADKSGKE
jgi:hypothetical protein